MPGGRQAVLSPAEEAFAQGQRVAVLATADARGRPHAVPVCFAYLGGRFYSPIDEKPKRTLHLRRLRNLAENPQAALLFHRYHDDWSRLGFLLVRGRAELVEDPDERGAALAALRQRYPQYRGMALEGRPLLRLTPERAAAWGRLD